MMKKLVCLSLLLWLSGCSTYQPVKSPCGENVFGKTKINQW